MERFKVSFSLLIFVPQMHAKMIEDDVFRDFQRGKIEPLYRKLYGKLILYASRQLGDEASFMAEDCVQDAIYKVYEMRDTFHSAATFKAYLYSCVHNRAISILRRQVAQENYLASHEEEYQSSLMEQEVLDLLFDAIRSLPERYRRLFDLSFEQGLKNAEVAALLNISESAVKKQKAALIKQLRDELVRRTGDDYLALLLLWWLCQG